VEMGAHVVAVMGFCAGQSVTGARRLTASARAKAMLPIKRSVCEDKRALEIMELMLGTAILNKTPMMAMATNSSTSVKPASVLFMTGRLLT
jgi:hypothetical protein